MATIVKKHASFYVVYRYRDSNGNSKQRWELFKTNKEAKIRKAEVELQISTNTFVTPNVETVHEYLNDWIATYGSRKWSPSMYQSQTGLIRNYIDPLIGSVRMQDVSPKTVNTFIQSLQKTAPVSTRTRKARTTLITSNTIEKIIKLLRCAFSQAVKLELISRNPFENAVLPKVEHAKRGIWTVDMIRTALDFCKDPLLKLCISISFACSCRLAEILGLTWDNVHISDADIGIDNARIDITQELERVSAKALEIVGDGDIYYIFEPFRPNESTRLVLKKPKTDSSVRTIWLPRSLALILREWKNQQDSMKDTLGGDYHDYGMVIALPTGRPCEKRLIEKSFSKLKDELGLPDVVFHSIRHSSTTYKLKLNHGDLKATQGDTGHAQINMITDVYSHIIDEDRKLNAQKFEEEFYQKPDGLPAPSENEEETEKLIAQIRSSPELLAKMAKLLKETKSEC